MAQHSTAVCSSVVSGMNGTMQLSGIIGNDGAVDPGSLSCLPPASPFLQLSQITSSFNLPCSKEMGKIVLAEVFIMSFILQLSVQTL